jgi:hypothetical protein
LLSIDTDQAYRGRMLSKTEVLALARSAKVAPEVVRDWLEGLPTTPELSARLARVYRALRFGASPPAVPTHAALAAISSRPELVA